MPHIKNLGIWEYKGVDLGFLKNFPSIEDLLISEAKNLASLRGIEVCRRIQSLDINYCPRLLEIEPIRALAELRIFTADKLKNLSSIDPLYEMDSIRHIGMSEVAPIKTIKDIAKMKEL